MRPRKRTRVPARRRGGDRRFFDLGALRAAWNRVRANGGGAGIDGVGIERFEQNIEAELDRLSAELSSGAYRPLPVRRIFVPKKGAGLRPLAIWSLRDRVAQRAVLDRIEPLVEPTFLECSHGYRPGRSVGTATRAVEVARDQGLRWVLDADIRDCFEQIEPGRLMRMLRRRVGDRRLLRLVGRWLETDVMQASGRFGAVGAGQGGALSPLLCNVYLHAFDVAMMRGRYTVVRYADDFVCLGRRRRDVEDARREAERVLGTLGLELNEHKTRITNFDQGFTFLGVFFIRDERHDV